MSLRVWLPLNKDIHNQGLENVAVTNNGGVLYNSAYRFQNVNQFLYTDKKCCDLFNDGDSFTLCGWIYLLNSGGDVSNSGFGGCNLYTSESSIVNGQTVYGGGFGIVLYKGSRYCHTIINTAEEEQTPVNFGYLPLNTWAHLCFTYDKYSKKAKSYLNGSLVGEASVNNWTVQDA